MKNLFRKNPLQQLENTIASLAKRGEQLSAKRVTAHDALDKAIKARQQALLSGDLDDQRALDRLQAAVDTAAPTLMGIDDALAVLACRVGVVQKLDVVADHGLATAIILAASVIVTLIMTVAAFLVTDKLIARVRR